ncbi:NADH:ubiquinone oxidoreductase subunit J [Candidatus Palibaumannia cicadellinicola]|uniref:NADH-quinone oxidoreductase subunit J n=1 Tax=Candidatus Palibaumannia cicadellinicola TaxID=186490 RepID=A0A2N4XXM1_9GAMM|nr:NADH-quinone oxidoreductase subunit J [Candidatus Baumannia cicadellinicola]PLK59397.1 NADH:ubiquinone oxidoreductase subunit J [Candidatus Baumannia cicadellinicola]
MELAFYFSSLVAIFAVLRVITHNQPIYALLYLIISLLAVACVFFSIGAYFAGALEIIVYAGAIMVLFVFVVMMLNMSSGCKQYEQDLLQLTVWLGPSILSIGLLIVLLHVFWYASDHNMSCQLIEAKKVGISLFGPYVLAVELVSILLLAGLVVAFHLGCDTRYNNKNTNSS